MQCSRFISVVSGVILLLSSSSATADSLISPEEFYHQSRLQIRATPVGTSLFSDTGYQFELWENQEGMLFENTRLDTGVTTGVSPAYLWGGPYLRMVPLAVLELRASLQAMGYWGTFGNLYVSERDHRNVPEVWDDDTLYRAWEEGLGQRALGWKFEVSATPRIRHEGWAAMVDVSYRRISMGVDGPYYEPYYDLLMTPTEHLWRIRPTVGYLFEEEFEDAHLLVGLRWERLVATRAETRRDIIAFVWDWGVPTDFLGWGAPRISGMLGGFVADPTRGPVWPYFGAQATVEF